jgi:hypothetical protein
MRRDYPFSHPKEGASMEESSTTQQRNGTRDVKDGKTFAFTDERFGAYPEVKERLGELADKLLTDAENQKAAYEVLKDLGKLKALGLRVKVGPTAEKRNEAITKALKDAAPVLTVAAVYIGLGILTWSYVGGVKDGAKEAVRELKSQGFGNKLKFLFA